MRRSEPGERVVGEESDIPGRRDSVSRGTEKRHSWCCVHSCEQFGLGGVKVMETVVNRHVLLTKKNIHINILMS